MMSAINLCLFKDFLAKLGLNTVFLFTTQKQGRNEFRWRPGQEASLASTLSNLRSFGSKCTVLKKVAYL